MPSIQGVFRNNNQVVAGATVSLFAASGFTTPPAKNTPLPSGAIQTVTSGAQFGYDGAYLFTGVAPGEYWVGASFYGTTLYEYVDLSGVFYGGAAAPTDGQVLTYSAASSGWVAATETDSLSGLVGVTLTGPADGQGLVYLAANAGWVNQAPKYATVLTPMACFTPALTGFDSCELTVPYSPVDGTTSLTFNVRRIGWRVSVSGSVSGQVTLEKSTVPGQFVPATIGTLTMPVSGYEVTATASLGTLASGNKVRANVIVLPTGAQNWTVWAELGQ